MDIPDLESPNLHNLCKVFKIPAQISCTNFRNQNIFGRLSVSCFLDIEPCFLRHIQRHTVTIVHAHFYANELIFQNCHFICSINILQAFKNNIWFNSLKVLNSWYQRGLFAALFIIIYSSARIPYPVRFGSDRPNRNLKILAQKKGKSWCSYLPHVVWVR